MDPPEDPSRRDGRQANRRRGYKPRARKCLLKGCERLFVPRHPQSRYCSDECREEAKKWRDWKSRQRYRKSERGRLSRREQSRRYRKRQTARTERGASFRGAAEGGREGDRPAKNFSSVVTVLVATSCFRLAVVLHCNDSAQALAAKRFTVFWRGSGAGSCGFKRHLGRREQLCGCELEVLPRGATKPTLSWPQGEERGEPI